MPINPNIVGGLKQPEFDTGQFVNLIAQGQQRRMQQETHAAQMQEHQQRIAANERAAKAAELKAKDDEISRREFVNAGGDLDKWEQGLLQNGASAEAVMSAQKHRGELLKQRAQAAKDQNEVTAARDKRMQGLIQESQAMAQTNPDLYRQSWGQIYGAIKALDPEVAQHLDEGTPLTAEQWQPFGLHYASQEWADKKVSAAQAAAKRKEEEAAATYQASLRPAGLRSAEASATEAEAKAGQSTRAATAAKLAAAQEQGQLGAALADLSPEMQQVFGGLKANAKPDDIRKMGLTADQRVNADLAARNAENNVSEYELELRAARGDRDAKAALANRQRDRIAAAAAGRDPNVRLDREIAQYGKPFDEIVKGADSQLDKVLDAEKMLAGGAVSQALGIPKILTALVSGQGSGVRITQAELNSIANARGLAGNVEGFFSKLTGNGTLTKEQKKQMEGILEDVRQRIVEKKMIARQAGEDMFAATDRAGVLRAAQNGKAKLDAHSSQPAGKVRTMDDVREFAKAHHLSEAEAKRQAEAEGYTIR